MSEERDASLSNAARPMLDLSVGRQTIRVLMQQNLSIFNIRGGGGGEVNHIREASGSEKHMKSRNCKCC